MLLLEGPLSELLLLLLQPPLAVWVLTHQPRQHLDLLLTSNFVWVAQVILSSTPPRLEVQSEVLYGSLQQTLILKLALIK